MEQIDIVRLAAGFLPNIETYKFRKNEVQREQNWEKKKIAVQQF